MSSPGRLPTARSSTGTTCDTARTTANGPASQTTSEPERSRTPTRTPAADVTHYYAVRAHNSAGNSPWSETASNQRVTLPTAPTGVNAALNDDDIVLTWTRPNSVHVNGYTVRHRAGASQEFVASERLAGTATSYTIADITSDTLYTLAVRAHNSAGDSPWSNDVEITRLLPPAAPTGVTAVASETDIVVSWTAPASGRVDGYHVAYRAASSEEWTQADTAADTVSFSHSDNTEGVEYSYRVRAHNTAGNSPWSETETATRLAVPGAPANVSAQVSGNNIIVSWEAPATGIIANYDVEYGVASNTDFQTETVGGTTTQFTHRNPTGDTQYRYRVRASNAAGDGPWSAPAEAMRIIPPPPPTAVSATIVENDLLISWTAPSTGIVDSYEVERQQLNNQDRTLTNAPSTSHTHAAPTPGITYQYRVRSVNEGGYSDWTEPVEAIWFRGAAPPSGIRVGPFGADRLQVIWNASITPGVSAYELRHRIDDGQWTTRQVNGIRTMVRMVRDQQSHHDFALRAILDGETGDWSPNYRATLTRHSAVKNVRAYRESSHSVRIHWDLPDSGQPASFTIQSKHKGADSFGPIAAAGENDRNHLEVYQDPDTTVTYRVLATNHVWQQGHHGPSSDATVTIPPDPHQPRELPGDLKVTMTDRDTVQLTWDAPKRWSDRVSSYRIYRKNLNAADVGSTSRHLHVSDTGNNSTTYIDHNFLPGASYEYAVAAFRIRYDPKPGPVSTSTAFATPW